MKRWLFLLVVLVFIFIIVGMSDRQEEVVFLYVEEINSHLLRGEPMPEKEVVVRDETRRTIDIKGNGEVFVLQEIKALDELVSTKRFWVSEGDRVGLTDDLVVQGIVNGELIENVVSNYTRLNTYDLEIINVEGEEVSLRLGEYSFRLGPGDIWGVAFIWHEGELVNITTDEDWEKEFASVWHVDSVVTILTVINYGLWQLGGND